MPLATRARQERLAQGGDGKRCPPKLFAIGQGPHGVLAVAEFVPVQPQSEAGVAVVA